MLKVDWNVDRFLIDDELLRKFRTIYPFFDDEIQKCEMWYLANPMKRKKNHYRFLVNWMNKHKPVKIVGRNYAIYDKEFKEKMETAEKECSPPTDDWLELKKKLGIK